VQATILNLLAPQKGHFLLESGHHGELWLNLEALFLRPRRLQPLIDELAKRLEPLGVDAICAPLVEGAFAGLMVAGRLDVEFTYSERFTRPAANGLFPAGYRVPAALRRRLQNKRVAIVNDVINAGSAVIGTYSDLRECGANVVAICALLVLGSAAAEFANLMNLALISLADAPNNLWTVQECPLCAAGVLLEDIAGFAASFSAKNTVL
jgi:orotate phosphoribosyltransferase